MQNFNNPYGNVYPNYYQQPRTNQYAFVNGFEGAKAFQVQPNQMVMLLDSDNPIVYKKTANSLGQCTIEAFNLVPIKEEVKTNDEYVSKAEFDALVKRIDELTKKESDK